MQTRATAIVEWLDRVRGEYLEMAGLRLTLAQGARFWSPDPGTCARAFPGRLLTTVTVERGARPLTERRT